MDPDLNEGHEWYLLSDQFQDYDGDGYANRIELDAGTRVGDRADFLGAALNLPPSRIASEREIVVAYGDVTNFINVLEGEADPDGD